MFTKCITQDIPDVPVFGLTMKAILQQQEKQVKVKVKVEVTL
jgi:hypothetical protein